MSREPSTTSGRDVASVAVADAVAAPATPPPRRTAMPAQEIAFWTPVRIGEAMIRVLTMRAPAAVPIVVTSPADVDEPS